MIHLHTDFYQVYEIKEVTSSCIYNLDLSGMLYIK